MATKLQISFHAAMTFWYFAYAIFVMTGAVYILGYRWDIVGNQCGFGIQYISLWVIALQTYYFTMRLKEDLTIDKEEKEKLSQHLTELFIYVVLPISVMITVIFWGVYTLDTRLVDRFDILLDFGSSVNHTTHTTTSIFVFAEALILDKPRKNIRLTDVFWINFAILIFYDLLLEGLFTLSGFYPYEFLTYLSDSIKPLVCAGAAALGVLTVLLAYTVKEYLPNYHRVHFRMKS